MWKRKRRAASLPVVESSGRDSSRSCWRRRSGSERTLKASVIVLEGELGPLALDALEAVGMSLPGELPESIADLVSGRVPVRSREWRSGRDSCYLVLILYNRLGARPDGVGDVPIPGERPQVTHPEAGEQRTDVPTGTRGFFTIARQTLVLVDPVAAPGDLRQNLVDDRSGWTRPARLRLRRARRRSTPRGRRSGSCRGAGSCAASARRRAPA